MTSGMPDLTGADSELDLILNGTYTCARVWEAWEVGMMFASDFEEAAHSPIVDDLIAWRDAAVAKALEAAGKPENTTPSLAERVTSCLLAADFRRHDHENRYSFPAFTVTEGVGVTVGVRWVNAGDDLRDSLLAEYAAALQAAGFTVSERDGCLYVPDSKGARQDSPTTATEDKP